MNHNYKYVAMVRINKPLIEKQGYVKHGQIYIALNIGNNF